MIPVEGDRGRYPYMRDYFLVTKQRNNKQLGWVFFDSEHRPFRKVLPGTENNYMPTYLWHRDYDLYMYDRWEEKFRRITVRAGE